MSRSRSHYRKLDKEVCKPRGWHRVNPKTDRCLVCGMRGLLDRQRQRLARRMAAQIDREIRRTITGENLLQVNQYRL